MKKFFVCIIIGGMVFSGCSGKNSSIKVGAIGAGITGALMGGLLGAAASEGHTGNGETTKSVLVGALIVGGLGALLGAGAGYVLEDSENKKKEMNEMIETEKMMEKL